MDDLTQHGFEEPSDSDRKSSRVPSGVGNIISKDALMQQQQRVRSVYNALLSFHDTPIASTSSESQNMNMSDVTRVKVSGLYVIHALI